MHHITHFIANYCDLSASDLEKVISAFVYQEIEKDAILLKKGQVAETMSFIAAGCFRVYALAENEKDVTTWIVFENTVVTEPTSFLTRQPSRYYVQALERSEVYTITHDSLQQLYNEIPAFQEFGRKLMEKLLVSSMCRTTFLLLDTPQERYERLLQLPEYMQRISLKILASYIGVTPTSLSRLRARKL
ncbi:Crp/Fnr family transcriptional regulator [Chitinophaga qingshengii]|uniref:Crp/Fnr family transcriptional regulator n=1 Tax=Chitinophaga qingshengii TaxID=1569794 RepID=A0ABR7TSU8_9BACT|nr:Crp/Fnr family transcriptional regulator [Chitinophaga qingshengii]MBC9933105.1 Crp/Fnr family transcriptional regulator [Chitinophaga qingshengii]